MSPPATGSARSSTSSPCRSDWSIQANSAKQHWGSPNATVPFRHPIPDLSIRYRRVNGEPAALLLSGNPPTCSYPSTSSPAATRYAAYTSSPTPTSCPASAERRRCRRATDHGPYREALAGRGFCIASERLRSVTASAGPEDWHPTVPVATMFTELSPPVKGSRSPSWFKMYDAAWSWETGNTKTQPPAPRELSHPEGARPDTPSPRIQGRNPSSQQYRTRQRPIRQIMLNAGG